MKVGIADQAFKNELTLELACAAIKEREVTLPTRHAICPMRTSTKPTVMAVPSASIWSSVAPEINVESACTKMVRGSSTKMGLFLCSTGS
jgi:hypothetical protein